MNEHCVPKINICFTFFLKMTILYVAQILISCFAKLRNFRPNFDFVFREISRNSREISRNTKLKFFEITKIKLFAAMHPTHAPPPSSLSNWDEFLAAFVIAILYKLVPTLTFFRVSDAFTWAGDAGGVQIWSFLTLPVWGQFSLGRSYKKYPASGGAKICGAWEYLIAPASQSKLGFLLRDPQTF